MLETALGAGGVGGDAFGEGGGVDSQCGAIGNPQCANGDRLDALVRPEGAVLDPHEVRVRGKHDVERHDLVVAVLVHRHDVDGLFIRQLFGLGRIRGDGHGARIAVDLSTPGRVYCLGFCKAVVHRLVDV